MKTVFTGQKVVFTEEAHLLGYTDDRVHTVSHFGFNNVGLVHMETGIVTHVRKLREATHDEIQNNKRLKAADAVG
jgi:hypothetical protein